MTNITALTIDEFLTMTWNQIEPYYGILETQAFDEGSVDAWLSDWSHLRKLVDEAYARLQLANARDTTDQAAEERYHRFLVEIYPPIQAADQRLKDRLLQSGLTPAGMEVPLQGIRAEAEIFCEENLPLLTEERKLGSAYNKILGAQTVTWEGEEITLTQLAAKAYVPDRDVREKAWRLAAERQLEDRQAINDLWVRALELRQQVAANAGLPDYRAYKWKQLHRFDYTPEDCKRFQRAIEEVVVPVANQIYEKHKTRLGIRRLRPWDLQGDQSTMRFPSLQAYQTVEEFIEITGSIFNRLHPKLGGYFDIMRREDLLDLENRKGKAPGGFCTSFATQGKPFIFMNAVGMETDVRVLLHESGHAFHVFERSHLPYHHQWRAGMEFNEVASTAMELLASPYLDSQEGGFFSPEEAKRSRLQHLENKLTFWPYMAVVDAFNHWVYENPEEAKEPHNCDAKWGELVDRFMPAIDWDGFEDVKVTGWHRKLHIHRYPFYYIEYGLSLLGAVQIWGNALENQAAAIGHYLEALALGGTAGVAQLYRAAGARLAFDSETLARAVSLMTRVMDELED